jgi:hypothetical protein
MRKLLLGLILGSCFATSVGCVMPMYSGDPVRRTYQMINTSENLRLFLEDWERFWMLDQPSHLSPHRTHGGLI